jgi:hypothetical protein
MAMLMGARRLPAVDWDALFARPHFAVLLSLLLGFGVATLLRPLCEGAECALSRGPRVADTRDRVFQYGDKCVEFKARPVPCGTLNAAAVLAVGDGV